MQKWEYRVVHLREDFFHGQEMTSLRLEEALNNLGEHGWELVGWRNLLTGDTETLHAIFKRPKQEEGYSQSTESNHVGVHGVH